MSLETLTYEELLAEADRLTAAASLETRIADRLGPGARLLTCDAAQPFLDRARALRRESAEDQNCVTAPAPGARAPGLRESVDTRTREQKIARLAAGSPFPLPAGMAEAAIASGHTVEAFALAVASHAVDARAAAAREADVAATVERILGSAEIARPTPLRAQRNEYPSAVTPTVSAEATAARIAAA